MASIQKYSTKKGDRWMYIIENGIDPSTGKRSRIKKRGFLKEKEAIKASIEAEYQLNKFSIDMKNKMLVKDMADEWLKAYSETGVKIGTIRIRKNESGHLKNFFGNTKLKDVTKHMYQKFLIDLKNKKLAQNTISGIHNTARMIFKRAMEQDILVQNPTDYVYMPKDKKTVEEIEEATVQDQYLEKHELQLFLEQAKKGKIDDYPIFLTLAWTGLRVGELVALKWKDIDFEEQTISITKTLYNEKNNTKDFMLVPPKTEGSIRKIDVEDDVLKVLKQHQLKQKEMILVLRDEYYKEDFVFGRMFGPYYGYPHFIKTIENRMAAILRKIPEIEKHLTPHSLRHTHTSLLAEAGVELLQIMDRLGHSDDETTTQVYLHITKDRKKEASQKFGELMRSL